MVLIFNFTSKFEDFLFVGASVLIGPHMLRRGIGGNIILNQRNAKRRGISERQLSNTWASRRCTEIRVWERRY